MRLFAYNSLNFKYLNSLTMVCTKGVQKVTKVLLRAACLFEGAIIHKVFHSHVEIGERA